MFTTMGLVWGLCRLLRERFDGDFFAVMAFGSLNGLHSFTPKFAGTIYRSWCHLHRRGADRTEPFGFLGAASGYDAVLAKRRLHAAISCLGSLGILTGQTGV